MDETPKSKCKACWVAHIICRCPVPMGLYNHLVGYLPTELKSKMAGRPPTSDEVSEKERGGLGLEIYKDNDWVDVTDKEEVESLLRTEEGNETDETNEPEMDVEIEIEDMVDDSIMASLIEGLQENNQFKFMENFNPKTSERVRRKKKKVQYFSSSGRNKNQMQQAYHGPDGRILSSGKDLCDCLQPSCPGCHYPCSKCNSGKCGSECRINRKWFYEKVEVEGTQISWMNEYIKKN
ncbi:putative ARL14 effector protein-like isoform X1 [Penaeus vannamei]|uniref:Putative ARL14 effector protein-like isoform X1 n=2 Tax=Penaeus vannamei TaxID=6689 RepID=A0A3R7NSL4_PENVA|nr:ARL14 effector protein-like isoform X3 [Penaeus vannamei]ROT65662.1 putative ARL14 effector protein-like isoform X1 [Penaeus vannamei]